MRVDCCVCTRPPIQGLNWENCKFSVEQKCHDTIRKDHLETLWHGKDSLMKIEMDTEISIQLFALKTVLTDSSLSLIGALSLTSTSDVIHERLFKK